VVTGLFYADGRTDRQRRTDMMKLGDVFRKFVNAPKITPYWDALVDICQRFP